MDHTLSPNGGSILGHCVSPRALLDYIQHGVLYIVWSVVWGCPWGTIAGHPHSWSVTLRHLAICVYMFMHISIRTSAVVLIWDGVFIGTL